jgi:hypothetical protein
MPKNKPRFDICASQWLNVTEEYVFDKLILIHNPQLLVISSDDTARINGENKWTTFIG